MKSSKPPMVRAPSFRNLEFLESRIERELASKFFSEKEYDKEDMLTAAKYLLENHGFYFDQFKIFINEVDFVNNFQLPDKKVIFCVYAKRPHIWVLFCCIVEQRNKLSVVFKDPSGDSIPAEIENKLKEVCPSVKIFVADGKDLFDKKNCYYGPLCLRNLDALLGIVKHTPKSSDIEKTFKNFPFMNSAKLKKDKKDYIQKNMKALAKNLQFKKALKEFFDKLPVRLIPEFDKYQQEIEEELQKVEDDGQENRISNIRKKYLGDDVIRKINESYEEYQNDKVPNVVQMFPAEMTQLYEVFEILSTCKTNKSFSVILQKICRIIGISYDQLTYCYQMKIENPEEKKPFAFQATEIHVIAKHINKRSNNIKHQSSQHLPLEEYLSQITVGTNDELLTNLKEKFLQLEENFRKVECEYKKWHSSTIYEINNWARKTKGSLGTTDEDICQSIAVMDRTYNLLEGNRLRPTQILSVLVFLKGQNNQGQLCQIQTGEGKTVIVSLLAAIKALQGVSVDVITSSPVLADEAVEKSKMFFSVFNLTVGTNNLGSSSICYSADILYGTISNFQFDYLRDTFEGMDIRKGRKFEQVILDEVDSMLVDNGGHIAKLATPYPGMESLKYIYIKIWQELHKAEQMFIEEVRSNVNNLLSRSGSQSEDVLQNMLKSEQDFIKNKIKESKPTDIPLIPPHLEDYANNKLETWIDNALYAKYNCNQYQQYRIIEGEAAEEDEEKEDIITPVDYQNTGVTMKNTIWSNGLHQFIQLKHHLQVTTETLTSSFISNISYIKKYEDKNIYGMTGTLGSKAEQELLSKIYNVDYARIPTYKKKIFEEIPLEVANEDYWHKKVVSEVMRTIKQGRSVLLICETEKDVLLLKKELEQFKKSIRIRVYANEDNSEETSEAVKVGDVILATNIAGRGTNFKTEASLEEKGGLHVCVCFLPCNLRVEEQAFGRTSRQGNKGSAQLIVRRSEIEVLELENPFPSEIKEKRDVLECQRLEHVKNVLVAELNFKDELFNMFSGFYKKMKQQKNKKEDAFLLQDLKEFWAFWLESKSFDVDEISRTNPQAEFDKFKQDAKSIIDGKISRNPYYLIALAQHYLEKCDPTKASIELQNAIELYGKGKSQSLIGAHLKLFQTAIEGGGVIKAKLKQAVSDCMYIRLQRDEEYKRKALQHLQDAKDSIKQEIDYLVTQVKDPHFQRILAKSGKNFFFQHLRSRFTCLEMYKNNIDTIIDCITTSKNEVAISGKISTNSGKFSDMKNTRHEMKDIMTNEIKEFQAAGMSCLLFVKELQDVPNDVINAVRTQILAGVACLTSGLAFPVAFPISSSVAKTLISAGITDLLAYSFSQKDFSRWEFLKAKMFSLCKSLLSLGLTTALTIDAIADHIINAFQELSDCLSEMDGICDILAAGVDKIIDNIDNIQMAAELAQQKQTNQVELLVNFSKDLAWGTAVSLQKNPIVYRHAMAIVEDGVRKNIINIVAEELKKLFDGEAALKENLHTTDEGEINAVVENFTKLSESKATLKMLTAKLPTFFEGTPIIHLLSTSVISIVHLSEFVRYCTKLVAHLKENVKGGKADNDVDKIIEFVGAKVATKMFVSLEKMMGNLKDIFNNMDMILNLKEENVLNEDNDMLVENNGEDMIDETVDRVIMVVEKENVKKSKESVKISNNKTSVTNSSEKNEQLEEVEEDTAKEIHADNNDNHINSREEDTEINQDVEDMAISDIMQGNHQHITISENIFSENEEQQEQTQNDECVEQRQVQLGEFEQNCDTEDAQRCYEEEENDCLEKEEILELQEESSDNFRNETHDDNIDEEEGQNETDESECNDMQESKEENNDEEADDIDKEAEDEVDNEGNNNNDETGNDHHYAETELVKTDNIFDDCLKNLLQYANGFDVQKNIVNVLKNVAKYNLVLTVMEDLKASFELFPALKEKLHTSSNDAIKDAVDKFTQLPTSKQLVQKLNFNLGLFLDNPVTFELVTSSISTIVNLSECWRFRRDLIVYLNGLNLTGNEENDIDVVTKCIAEMVVTKMFTILEDVVEDAWDIKKGVHHILKTRTDHEDKKSTLNSEENKLLNEKKEGVLKDFEPDANAKDIILNNLEIIQLFQDQIKDAMVNKVINELKTLSEKSQLLKEKLRTTKIEDIVSEVDRFFQLNETTTVIKNLSSNILYFIKNTPFIELITSGISTTVGISECLRICKDLTNNLEENLHGGIANNSLDEVIKEIEGRISVRMLGVLTEIIDNTKNVVVNVEKLYEDGILNQNKSFITYIKEEALETVYDPVVQDKVFNYLKERVKNLINQRIIEELKTSSDSVFKEKLRTANHKDIYSTVNKFTELSETKALIKEISSEIIKNTPTVRLLMTGISTTINLLECVRLCREMISFMKENIPSGNSDNNICEIIENIGTNITTKFLTLFEEIVHDSSELASNIKEIYDDEQKSEDFKKIDSVFDSILETALKATHDTTIQERVIGYFRDKFQQFVRHKIAEEIKKSSESNLVLKELLCTNKKEDIKAVIDSLTQLTEFKVMVKTLNMELSAAIQNTSATELLSSGLSALINMSECVRICRELILKLEESLSNGVVSNNFELVVEEIGILVTYKITCLLEEVLDEVQCIVPNIKNVYEGAAFENTEIFLTSLKEKGLEIVTNSSLQDKAINYLKSKLKNIVNTKVVKELKKSSEKSQALEKKFRTSKIEDICLVVNKFIVLPETKDILKTVSSDVVKNIPFNKLLTTSISLSINLSECVRFCQELILYINENIEEGNCNNDIDQVIQEIGLKVTTRIFALVEDVIKDTEDFASSVHGMLNGELKAIDSTRTSELDGASETPVNSAIQEKCIRYLKDQFENFLSKKITEEMKTTFEVNATLKENLRTMEKAEIKLVLEKFSQMAQFKAIMKSLNTDLMSIVEQTPSVELLTFGISTLSNMSECLRLIKELILTLELNVHGGNADNRIDDVVEEVSLTISRKVSILLEEIFVDTKHIVDKYGNQYQENPLLSGRDEGSLNEYQSFYQSIKGKVLEAANNSVLQKKIISYLKDKLENIIKSKVIEEVKKSLEDDPIFEVTLCKSDQEGIRQIIHNFSELPESKAVIKNISTEVLRNKKSAEFLIAGISASINVSECIRFCKNVTLYLKENMIIANCNNDIDAVIEEIGKEVTAKVLNMLEALTDDTFNLATNVEQLYELKNEHSQQDVTIINSITKIASEAASNPILQSTVFNYLKHKFQLFLSGKIKEEIRRWSATNPGFKKQLSSAKQDDIHSVVDKFIQMTEVKATIKTLNTELSDFIGKTPVVEITSSSISTLMNLSECTRICQDLISNLEKNLHHGDAEGDFDLIVEEIGTKVTEKIFVILDEVVMDAQNTIINIEKLHQKEEKLDNQDRVEEYLTNTIIPEDVANWIKNKLTASINDKIFTELKKASEKDPVLNNNLRVYNTRNIMALVDNFSKLSETETMIRTISSDMVKNIQFDYLLTAGTSLSLDIPEFVNICEELILNLRDNVDDEEFNNDIAEVIREIGMKLTAKMWEIIETLIKDATDLPNKISGILDEKSKQTNLLFNSIMNAATQAAQNSGFQEKIASYVKTKLKNFLTKKIEEELKKSLEVNIALYEKLRTTEKIETNSVVEKFLQLSESKAIIKMLGSQLLSVLPKTTTTEFLNFGISTITNLTECIRLSKQITAHLEKNLCVGNADNNVDDATKEISLAISSQVFMLLEDVVIDTKDMVDKSENIYEKDRLIISEENELSTLWQSIRGRALEAASNPNFQKNIISYLKDQLQNIIKNKVVEEVKKSLKNEAVFEEKLRKSSSEDIRLVINNFTELPESKALIKSISSEVLRNNKSAEILVAGVSAAINLSECVRFCRGVILYLKENVIVGSCDNDVEVVIEEIGKQVSARFVNLLESLIDDAQNLAAKVDEESEQNSTMMNSIMKIASDAATNPILQNTVMNHLKQKLELFLNDKIQKEIKKCSATNPGLKNKLCSTKQEDIDAVIDRFIQLDESKATIKALNVELSNIMKRVPAVEFLSSSIFTVINLSECTRICQELILNLEKNLLGGDAENDFELIVQGIGTKVSQKIFIILGEIFADVQDAVGTIGILHEKGILQKTLEGGETNSQEQSLLMSIKIRAEEYLTNTLILEEVASFIRNKLKLIINDKIFTELKNASEKDLVLYNKFRASNTGNIIEVVDKFIKLSETKTLIKKISSSIVMKIQFDDLLTGRSSLSLDVSDCLEVCQEFILNLKGNIVDGDFNNDVDEVIHEIGKKITIDVLGMIEEVIKNTTELASTINGIIDEQLKQTNSFFNSVMNVTSQVVQNSVLQEKFVGYVKIKLENFLSKKIEEELKKSFEGDPVLREKLRTTEKTEMNLVVETFLQLSESKAIIRMVGSQLLSIVPKTTSTELLNFGISTINNFTECIRLSKELTSHLQRNLRVGGADNNVTETTEEISLAISRKVFTLLEDVMVDAKYLVGRSENIYDEGMSAILGEDELPTQSESFWESLREKALEAANNPMLQKKIVSYLKDKLQNIIKNNVVEEVKKTLKNEPVFEEKLCKSNQEHIRLVINNFTELSESKGLIKDISSELLRNSQSAEILTAGVSAGINLSECIRFCRNVILYLKQNVNVGNCNNDVDSVIEEIGKEVSVKFANLLENLTNDALKIAVNIDQLYVFKDEESDQNGTMMNSVMKIASEATTNPILQDTLMNYLKQKLQLFLNSKIQEEIKRCSVTNPGFKNKLSSTKQENIDEIIVSFTEMTEFKATIKGLNMELSKIIRRTPAVDLLSSSISTLINLSECARICQALISNLEKNLAGGRAENDFESIVEEIGTKVTQKVFVILDEICVDAFDTIRNIVKLQEKGIFQITQEEGEETDHQEQSLLKSLQDRAEEYFTNTVLLEEVASCVRNKLKSVINDKIFTELKNASKQDPVLNNKLRASHRGNIFEVVDNFIELSETEAFTKKIISNIVKKIQFDNLLTVGTSLSSLDASECVKFCQECILNLKGNVEDGELNNDIDEIIEEMGMKLTAKMLGIVEQVINDMVDLAKTMRRVLDEDSEQTSSVLQTDQNFIFQERVISYLKLNLENFLVNKIAEELKKSFESDIVLIEKLCTTEKIQINLVVEEFLQLSESKAIIKMVGSQLLSVVVKTPTAAELLKFGISAINNLTECIRLSKELTAHLERNLCVGTANNNLDDVIEEISLATSKGVFILMEEIVVNAKYIGEDQVSQRNESFFESMKETFLQVANNSILGEKIISSIQDNLKNVVKSKIIEELKKTSQDDSSFEVKLCTSKKEEIHLVVNNFTELSESKAFIKNITSELSGKRQGTKLLTAGISASINLSECVRFSQKLILNLKEHLTPGTCNNSVVQVIEEIGTTVEGKLWTLLTAIIEDATLIKSNFEDFDRTCSVFSDTVNLSSETFGSSIVQDKILSYLKQKLQSFLTYKITEEIKEFSKSNPALKKKLCTTNKEITYSLIHAFTQLTDFKAAIKKWSFHLSTIIQNTPFSELLSSGFSTLINMLECARICGKLIPYLEEHLPGGNIDYNFEDIVTEIGKMITERAFTLLDEIILDAEKIRSSGEKLYQKSRDLSLQGIIPEIFTSSMVEEKVVSFFETKLKNIIHFEIVEALNRSCDSDSELKKKLMTTQEENIYLAVDQFAELLEAKPIMNSVFSSFMKNTSMSELLRGSPSLSISVSEFSRFCEKLVSLLKENLQDGSCNNDMSRVVEEIAAKISTRVFVAWETIIKDSNHFQNQLKQILSSEFCIENAIKNILPDASTNLPFIKQMFSTPQLETIISYVSKLTGRTDINDIQFYLKVVEICNIFFSVEDFNYDMFVERGLQFANQLEILLDGNGNDEIEDLTQEVCSKVKDFIGYLSQGYPEYLTNHDLSQLAFRMSEHILKVLSSKLYDKVENKFTNFLMDYVQMQPGLTKQLKTTPIDIIKKITKDFLDNHRFKLLKICYQVSNVLRNIPEDKLAMSAQDILELSEFAEYGTSLLINLEETLPGGVDENSLDDILREISSQIMKIITSTMSKSDKTDDIFRLDGTKTLLWNIVLDKVMEKIKASTRNCLENKCLTDEVADMMISRLQSSEDISKLITSLLPDMLSSFDDFLERPLATALMSNFSLSVNLTQLEWYIVKLASQLKQSNQTSQISASKLDDICVSLEGLAYPSLTLFTNFERTEKKEIKAVILEKTCNFIFGQVFKVLEDILKSSLERNEKLKEKFSSSAIKNIINAMDEFMKEKDAESIIAGFGCDLLVLLEETMKQPLGKLLLKKRDNSMLDANSLQSIFEHAFEHLPNANCDNDVDKIVEEMCLQIMLKIIGALKSVLEDNEDGEIERIVIQEIEIFIQTKQSPELKEVNASSKCVIS